MMMMINVGELVNRRWNSWSAFRASSSTMNPLTERELITGRCLHAC